MLKDSSLCLELSFIITIIYMINIKQFKKEGKYMIDTNAIKPMETKIEMYPIDLENFVKEHHQQLADYLKEQAPCPNIFEDSLALSRDGKELTIGCEGTAYVDIGYKQKHYFAQKDKGFSDWVDSILQNYANYLRRQRNAQIKMDNKELNALLYKNPRKALFSSRSYIDWVIANFANFSFERGSYPICYNFIFGYNTNNYDYLSDRLVIALNNIKQIRANTINEIVNVLRHYYLNLLGNKQIKDRNVYQIIKQLYDLVNDVDKIISNVKVDYTQLLILVRCMGTIKEINLPLKAVLQADINYQYFKTITFTVTNKDEVPEFISLLIGDSVYKNTVFNYLKDFFSEHTVRFKLNKGQALFDQYLTDMQTKFSNVEILKQTANILNLIKQYAV